MKYNELLKKLNSFDYSGKLIVIYQKAERFGNSILYAKGVTMQELSSSIIDAKLNKGSKGVFQIVEL